MGKKVLISGGSGLIGRALREQLPKEGSQVITLVRREEQAGPAAFLWDPAGGKLDPRALEGVDAIVNLAGESIGEGRWSEARKAEILASRVKSTRLLGAAAAQAGTRPVFISASAVGYYGDTGEAWVDEHTPRGKGFLAEVCEQWEAACEPARTARCRVVNPRFGIVLSKDGGALRSMLPVFRLGLGGPLSSGTQFMSWVSLEDAARAILFAIDHDAISGPMNVVAPEPVTNDEFTKTLGAVLGRPAFARAPAVALKLALGSEMAEELLLSGQRVRPSVLNGAGYSFAFAGLRDALLALGL